MHVVRKGADFMWLLIRYGEKVFHGYQRYNKRFDHQHDGVAQRTRSTTPKRMEDCTRAIRICKAIETHPHGLMILMISMRTGCSSLSPVGGAVEHVSSVVAVDRFASVDEA